MDYGRFRVVAWVGALASAVALSVAPPVAAQSATIEATPWALTSREILIQSDHEGVLLQRLTADIAGTRWLWRSEGSVLLYEESAMAGGYIEERRTLGSPVEDLTHTVGCEVGPLTLGPISFRGTYHRLLDPTAGGTEWSALTDGNALVLDRSLDSSRWTAVGLSGVLPISFFGGDVAPGVVWSSDDEGEIAAAVLPVSWPSGAVELSVARGSFSVTTDDSWLHEAPPFRAGGVTQLGTTFTARPTVSGVPVALGVEGWQQRVGYRPPRYSVQAFGRAPADTVSVTARISRTDSGFRTLTGSRPRSSEFSGVTMSEGRRVRPLIWRVSWDRRAGWEDDLPGATVDTCSGAVGLARTRGVTRLLRLQSTIDSRGMYSLDYRMRFAGGAVGLVASARHDFEHPTRGDHLSATVRLSIRTALGHHRRRFSASAGWNVGEEEQRWEQAVSVNASAPVGGAFRLELSATLPLMYEAPPGTMEWLIRLRNTGPHRRR